jgi:hypothetical protein
MWSLLLLAATPVAYEFPPDSRSVYEVRVRFDGYLPILGGQEAAVDLEMEVTVEGLSVDEEGRPRAASSIEQFRLSLDGARMPMGADSIRHFFPRTTVALSPQGRVLATDAPDVELPVRLPGLDAKRFPDITYLPIEFPAGGVEEGVPFRFRKSFGGSEVEYTVTPTKVGTETIDLAIRLEQDVEQHEDVAGRIVEAERAAFRVRQKLTGSGTATFDRSIGQVRSVHVETAQTSRVTALADNREFDRKLKTTLSTKRK